MPVSFSPAPHNKAESVTQLDVASDNTPAAILQRACHKQSKKAKEILQSSFPSSPDINDGFIIPTPNGFVRTIVTAYNNHYALVLRPDDVWLAILTQFSFYVNGNAELLRSQFVQHEGKKELVIKTAGTRYTVDFGRIAQQMTSLIQDNVVDPSLREWILPAFSTTTLNDTIVCSVTMMATLKEYFSYKAYLMCGIPRVTLEGDRVDWEKLLSKAEKLGEYGSQATEWLEILKPVLSRFVRAFDDPDGKENLDFWQRVAHYDGGGSGPTYLCGWITAFTVFDEKGKWIRKIHQKPTEARDEEGFTPEGGYSPPSLLLDNVVYHSLDTSDIPGGFAEVDVKLDDNGQQLNTVMVAGMVGIRVGDSGDKDLSETGKNDEIKPAVGWWIFETQAEEAEAQ